MRSKSLLVSSFKKHHEDKHSNKRAKKEEMSLSSKPSLETRPSSERFATLESRNTKTCENKENIFKTSLAVSDLVASLLASSTCSHSSLRPKRRFSARLSLRRSFLLSRIPQVYQLHLPFLFKTIILEKITIISRKTLVF